MLRRVSWWLVPVSLVCGCRGEVPGEEGPGTDGMAVTIGELVAGEPEDRDGETVVLRDVVVVAHDTFDESGAGRVGTVHLVDPGNEPGHGLQTFAPVLDLPVGDSLSPGDLVDVEGTFVRFLGPGCPPNNCFMGRELPQLSIGARVSRTGFWQEPQPVELEVAEYLADPGRYVGNLITLRDLTASGSYAPAGGGTRIDPFPTAEGVEVAAELYMIPGVEAGTRIERLTGVAGYFFDDFVMPRSAEDVVLAEGT